MAAVKVVLAHLSDTHLDGGKRAAARTRQVMAYLDRLPVAVDAVVHTGDITHNGREYEHEQAAEVLVSRHPLYTCPGNHDGLTAYHWPLNRVYEIGEAVLLMCDSVILGRDDGYLADTTLDWVVSTLDTHRGRPAFVALHHPPQHLHHSLADRIMLGDPHRLERVVRAHPDVVAILCGHAHTPAVSTFAGVPVIVAPAVASTLVLPWEVDTLTPKNNLDYGIPPAIAFHVLDSERRITTHFRLICD